MRRRSRWVWSGLVAAPWLLWGCPSGSGPAADAGSDSTPATTDPCERLPGPPAPPAGETDDDAGVPDDAAAMPRNVILLMGDGVGSDHWRAARIARDGPLSVDGLAGPTLYRTDSASYPLVTDSAAAATAIATGRCTHNGRLSVTADDAGATTALELAQAAGKRTGVVTNTLLLDASPMAFVSHTFSRTCLDTITSGALSTRPDVWLGGGLPATALTSEQSLETRAEQAGYHVVTTWPLSRDALPEDAPLLGAFGLAPNTAPWPAWEWGLTPEALREAPADEPTLAEMTDLALSRLGESREGFFLFVENEHPDTIGHAAYADPPAAAAYLPAAVLELDAALAVALAWVDAHSDFDETLVMVASDHENGGYTFEEETPEGLLRATFPASPSHTSAPVPLYVKGPGREHADRVQHISHLYYLLTGRGGDIPDSDSCPDVTR